MREERRKTAATCFCENINFTLSESKAKQQNENETCTEIQTQNENIVYYMFSLHFTSSYHLPPPRKKYRKTSSKHTSTWLKSCKYFSDDLHSLHSVLCWTLSMSLRNHTMHRCFNGKLYKRQTLIMKSNENIVKKVFNLLHFFNAIIILNVQVKDEEELRVVKN